MVDFSSSPEGSFTSGHTEKRCAELLESLQEIVKADKVEVKALEKLHGRLYGLTRIWKGTECGSAYYFSTRENEGSEDVFDALETIFQATARNFTIRLGRNISEVFMLADAACGDIGHP